jgi:metal-responsive CopG/Arc/MetJ family transcriptional regulator
MKTAISIPDKIFSEAEQLAHLLGISRSELFTKAVIEFLERKNTNKIIEKLNDLYSKEDSILKVNDYKLQMKSLDLLKDEW